VGESDTRYWLLGGVHCHLSCKAYVPLLSSHSHHPVFLWSNCICSTCRVWQILVPFTILISLPVSHIFVVAFGDCNPQPLCIKNNYLAISAWWKVVYTCLLRVVIDMWNLNFIVICSKHFNTACWIPQSCSNKTEYDMNHSLLQYLTFLYQKDVHDWSDTELYLIKSTNDFIIFGLRFLRFSKKAFWG
jgi:hypothetical protein